METRGEPSTVRGPGGVLPAYLGRTFWGTTGKNAYLVPGFMRAEPTRWRTRVEAWRSGNGVQVIEFQSRSAPSHLSMFVDHVQRGFLHPTTRYLIADYRCWACTRFAEEYRSRALAAQAEILPFSSTMGGASPERLVYFEASFPVTAAT